MFDVLRRIHPLYRLYRWEFLREEPDSPRTEHMRHGYIATGCLAFVCGLLIYVLFRKGTLIHAVIPGLFPVIGINPDNPILSWFVYSGVDGLWFLSGVCIIRGIWHDQRKWFYVYYSLFSIIAIGMECIQLIGSFPGTFDVLDILSFGIMAFFEAFVYTIIMYKKMYKRSFE